VQYRSYDEPKAKYARRYPKGGNGSGKSYANSFFGVAFRIREALRVIFGSLLIRAVTGKSGGDIGGWYAYIKYNAVFQLPFEQPSNAKSNISAFNAVFLCHIYMPAFVDQHFKWRYKK